MNACTPIGNPRGARRAVLIHSLAMDRHFWRPVVEWMDGSVLLYDCRGHGASQKAGPYSVDGFAADLAALLDDIGWQSALVAGVLRPARLVSLRKLGLEEIETRPGGELHVGAMRTLGELERSAALRHGWPVITRASRTLANVRVREVAIAGGNLAHGDPHMDLPPLLSD